MNQFSHARVIASVPGYLRVEVPQLYRSDEVKLQLECAAAAQQGVRNARANPLTARILILLEPDTDPAVVLMALGMAPGDATEVPEARGEGPASPARGPTVRPDRQHLLATPAAGSGGGARLPAPAASSSVPVYAPWHTREADEALAFFDSSLEYGLSSKEATLRLQQGANIIPPAPPRTGLDILLNQFKSLPIILLGVSAVVSVLTGGLAEAAAIGAVLVLNGGIGFYTERRAEATVASLSELVGDIAVVLRGGEVTRIDASQVVQGDILLLGPGTRLAADARLLQTNGLLIDEAALTGESGPVSKHSGVLTGKPPLAERSNMAYRGTAVAAGAGSALVVGTGVRTEAGAIERMMRSAQRPMTPTQVQLDQLGTQLIKAGSAMCVAIFGVGLLRGYDRLTMFKTAVSLAIAAVPEGLPAVATTSLARGLGRMREKNVLIRQLHAVETIGAIQTICLDKTGTLTLNAMTVMAVRTVGRDIDPAAIDPVLRTGLPELDRLLQTCCLCSESGGEATRGGTPQSSATEQALAALAYRGGIAPSIRDDYPLVASELRAEGRNFMRTIHQVASDSGLMLVAVKGSPDEVMALCQSYLTEGGAQTLDDAVRGAIMAQNDAMARRQLRVLGFAFTQGKPDQVREAALTWIGLVGLADPLRPGVEKFIQRFHDAGIATVMLTGDQAGTAHEIGKQLQLSNGGQLKIVSSDQLEDIEPERLRELVAGVHIFSRVTPSHKLRIVQALQHAGKVVAMTGDGINDGPALRAADVGIAMGSGTSVALAAADIALKNDDLNTVLEAVGQGRTISTNIRKSVHFLLSSNISEILLVAGSVSAGLGQPLTPLQLLWVNLLTDILPAIALAAEPAEPGLMRRPPRPPRQPIVDKDDLWRYVFEGGALAAGAVGAYGYGVARYGQGTRAGTIAFNTLVVGQMLHALFCRSDRHRTFFDASLPPNRQLVLAIVASLGLQAAAHLVPGLRRLLGVAPLSPSDLIVVIAGAVAPVVLNELGKKKHLQ